MRLLAFGLLLCGLFFSSCTTKQPPRPVESYITHIEMPLPSSEIEIPIRLARPEIEALVNSQLQEVLFDNSAEEKGLSIRAYRTKPIQLFIFSNAVRYTVPIGIDVAQNMLLTTLTGNGELELNFKTEFHIDPSWVITTKTSVEGYNWLKKPVVNLGFANLPIEFIGNTVMRNARDQIAASIDAELAKNLQLRSELQNAWNQLFTPVTLSEEYRTHLLINPEDISMTPLRSQGDTIAAEIHVRCLPDVRVGPRPEAPPPTLLPSYSVADQANKGFQVRLRTVVPFEEAEAIARESLKGYQYAVGRKKVTVQDVELYGQDEKLVVGTQLSGAYNGTVYLKGRPQYDPSTEKIALENMEFDFSTKKTLFKTAAWLFKGRLERQLQDNLDFYTAQNLSYLRQQITDGITNNQLHPGVLLNGQVNTMDIQHISLTKEGFLLTLFLEGHVDVRVQALQLIQEK